MQNKTLVFLMLYLTANACKPFQSTSDTKHLVSEDLSDESVAYAIKADFALKINLTTNRLTYYRNGEFKDQWNVATADILGRTQRSTKETPTGIFSAHAIEHCPKWLPSAPKDPNNNNIPVIVVDEETAELRRKILDGNPKLYGPCGATNPLGAYAIWFYDTYGTHGTAKEAILDLPVEDRRVSAGCIRNPNEKIKQIFDDVLTKLPDFRGEVDKNIAAKQKQTVAMDPRSAKVRINIIIGNWDTDPQEEFKPQWCEVKYASPKTGLLDIWKQANPFKDQVGTYSKGERVLILDGAESHFETDKGFVNKHYFGNCKTLLDDIPRKIDVVDESKQIVSSSRGSTKNTKILKTCKVAFDVNVYSGFPFTGKETVGKYKVGESMGLRSLWSIQRLLTERVVKTKLGYVHGAIWFLVAQSK